MAAAPPEQPGDAKPQESGPPPPPPDMEELVEDIEYEARVDRDVSGVVDVVRDALEDHDVGAPLRQPPPNADHVPGPPLKQRLRAQLRFQVNRRRIIEEAKLMAGAE